MPGLRSTAEPARIAVSQVRPGIPSQKPHFQRSPLRSSHLYPHPMADRLFHFPSLKLVSTLPTPGRAISARKRRPATKSPAVTPGCDPTRLTVQSNVPRARLTATMLSASFQCTASSKAPASLRGHWSAIENGIHYRRGITFAEDACTTASRKGAAVLASLRNLANGHLRTTEGAETNQGRFPQILVPAANLHHRLADPQPVKIAATTINFRGGGPVWGLKRVSHGSGACFFLGENLVSWS